MFPRFNRDRSVPLRIRFPGFLCRGIKTQKKILGTLGLLLGIARPILAELRSVGGEVEITCNAGDDVRSNRSQLPCVTGDERVLADRVNKSRKPARVLMNHLHSIRLEERFGPRTSAGNRKALLYVSVGVLLIKWREVC